MVITNASFTPCQGGASEVSGGSCTFTGNGSFTFEFMDGYGNTGQETASVTRIDTQAPVVVLSGNTNVTVYSGQTYTEK